MDRLDALRELSRDVALALGVAARSLLSHGLVAPMATRLFWVPHVRRNSESAWLFPGETERLPPEQEVVGSHPIGPMD